MKYKFIILLFLWLGMIGYGCQSKSEQNKIVSEYSSLILDHVFLSCGSTIFFITCHCFSVRLVGSSLITYLFATLKLRKIIQLTN